MKKPSTEKVIIVHRPQKPHSQETAAPTETVVTEDSSQAQAPDDTPSTEKQTTKK